MGDKPSEFDLIARIRTRAMLREDVLLGIGDDAAILRVPTGCDLVVSTDTLNSGVHFPYGTAPFDIGWKALAVNLSDLAAMGAQPAWCTLNLTLPAADAAWLDGFLDGFLGLATRHGVALVGGDTTRGPLSITVTVHGFVPQDAALRRDRAVVGDAVWVSGTLGDAAAGLALWLASNPSPSTVAPSDPYPFLPEINKQTPSPASGRRQGRGNDFSHTRPHPNPPPQAGEGVLAQSLASSGRVPAILTVGSPSPLAGEGLGRGRENASNLLARLHRPTPRVALGLALRGIAHACIDVSDGLLADLGHILDASKIGARIDTVALPTSPALSTAFDETARQRFQLGGGDDYELCFTALADRADDVLAAARAAGVAITRIGVVEAEHGLRLRQDDGTLFDAPTLGYRHFDSSREPVDPA